MEEAVQSWRVQELMSSRVKKGRRKGSHRGHRERAQSSQSKIRVAGREIGHYFLQEVASHLRYGLEPAEMERTRNSGVS